MRENIIIIEDSDRNIDYDSALAFYEYKKVKPDFNMRNLNSYDLVIVDIKDRYFEDIIHNIRMVYPHINILLILDYKDNTGIDIIENINGYGKILVLNYKVGYQEIITEKVQFIMHPEYPSKSFSIAIIIPIYNEEERINHVYRFIEKLKILIENSFINIKIYFVNDGSDDNTDELINKLMEKNNNDGDYIYKNTLIECKNILKNTKKAGAYIEGIRNINADIYIFSDGDDSFEIDDIAKMINLLEIGYYDIIAGTKDFSAKNRSMIRRILSFFKRFLTKPLLPKGAYDAQTGLKAIRGESARLIFPHLKEEMGLAIDLEMLFIAKKLNLRTMQLPVNCIDRDGSHVDIVKDSIKYLKNIFKIYNAHKNLKI
ncbi:glycosyltransferase [Peptostreptococcaceae bacterium AGR-M142]